MSLMLSKDGRDAPSITPTPSNAKWVDMSDFTFSIDEVLSLRYDEESCQFVGRGRSGKVLVTATHKITGVSAEFYVYIAEFDEGTYFLQEDFRNNKDVIEYNFETDKMQRKAFDGSASQKWNIIYAGEGYYAFISDVSGLAITCPTDAGNGTQLQAVSYNANNDWQKWSMTKEGDSYVIKSKSVGNSELYLGVNESGQHHIQLSNIDYLWFVLRDYGELDYWTDANIYINQISYWKEIPVIKCVTYPYSELNYDNDVTNDINHDFEAFVSVACDKWSEGLEREISYTVMDSSRLRDVPTEGFYVIQLDRTEFYNLTGVTWEIACNDDSTDGLTISTTELRGYAYSMDGNTKVYHNVHEMIGAICYILEDPDSTEAELTTLHEMGHGLGIYGHINNYYSVMYVFPDIGWNNLELNDDEILHLKQIYDLIDTLG